MDYQPMTYSVSILGKTYILPPRTIDIDSRIEEAGNLDRLYKLGKLSRLEVLKQMHAFAEALAPGALPPLEEVDVNELTAACVSIMEAYTVDFQGEHMNKKLGELNDLLKRVFQASYKK